MDLEKTRLEIEAYRERKEKEKYEWKNLKQGSKEWRDARQKFTLTASEFAAAIGICPYTSRKELLERKLQKIEVPVNFAMQWGINNEAEARDLAEQVLKLAPLPQGLDNIDTSDIVVVETGIWPIEGTSWAASPDGIVKTQYGDPGSTLGIMEIKCPYSQVLPTRIPPSHLLQMLGQMVAVGTDTGFYVSWTPQKMIIYTVTSCNATWELMEGYLQEFDNLLEEHEQHGVKMQVVIKRAAPNSKKMKMDLLEHMQNTHVEHLATISTNSALGKTIAWHKMRELGTKWMNNNVEKEKID